MGICARGVRGSSEGQNAENSLPESQEETADVRSGYGAGIPDHYLRVLHRNVVSVNSYGNVGEKKNEQSV